MPWTQVWICQDLHCLGFASPLFHVPRRLEDGIKSLVDDYGSKHLVTVALYDDDSSAGWLGHFVLSTHDIGYPPKLFCAALNSIIL